MPTLFLGEWYLILTKHCRWPITSASPSSGHYNAHIFWMVQNTTSGSHGDGSIYTALLLEVVSLVA